jgi:hypothetical protein
MSLQQPDRYQQERSAGKRSGVDTGELVDSIQPEVDAIGVMGRTSHGFSLVPQISISTITSLSCDGYPSFSFAIISARRCPARVGPL